jgi:hypothetical protein
MKYNVAAKSPSIHSQSIARSVYVQCTGLQQAKGGDPDVGSNTPIEHSTAGQPIPVHPNLQYL